MEIRLRPFAAIHRYSPVCYLRQKADILNRQKIQDSESSIWSLSAINGLLAITNIESQLLLMTHYGEWRNYSYFV